MIVSDDKKTTTGNEVTIETWTLLTWLTIITWDEVKNKDGTAWNNIGNKEVDLSEILSNGYSRELNDAYQFAYKNWITTMNTIESANIGWKLDRIAMAKMLSQYAIKILWMTPDESKINKFNDVTTVLDAEYNNWVTLAYQLWIMWINMPNNNFRPKDLVTRAEFATALSRMLFWTRDGVPYYVTHLKKLKEEWIISNDDPKMKELRWYVMLMLMRSINKTQ